ncbi:MAG: aminopeptidase N [Epsilonproteobacteria bacterium]|nr:MAG: aminopeptidase N [Campylobacterota bacterium]
MNEPKTIYLSDYLPPSHHISHCELSFDIFDKRTVVTNEMRVIANNAVVNRLELNGESLKLLSLECDGVELNLEQYTCHDTTLELFDIPRECTLRIVTEIYPEDNTYLEGLYRSGDIYCTQNEPEGFRRISYFIDRPDNMTIFTTKVTANKEKFPILLSNGNLMEEGAEDDGRHFAIWHDPFPKPSYLFALVAGDLSVVHDSYTTMSANEVALNIYVDRGNESKCSHAMRSLKAAMQWDEKQYGREYDLSVYNIVAVDSFNMGAMENKGLNIFNSHYVLADEETATDHNFLGIESVIAHEYFHNWTGNRITCRDWFQLTLKEGLTVFRDQCFSADMNSEVVQRIRDVKALRERQFVEDDGPTAHPIKPQSYIEINNFYTATVYEKGAEVIRMLHTLLGAEKFHAGMDRYFENFDGQAVRTEDFLWALRQETDLDLTQFEHWYTQDRTPHLKVDEEYNAQTQTYRVSLKQLVPDSVSHNKQLPYFYPLRFALLKSDGGVMEQENEMLYISKMEETFIFENIAEAPRLSVNRGYSAPLKLDFAKADYHFLMCHDSDGFSRYEAAQSLALNVMDQMMKAQEIETHYHDAFGVVLADNSIDLQFKSQLLELPSIHVLMQMQEVMDAQAAVTALETMTQSLAERYKEQMLTLYAQLHVPEDSSLAADSMGSRALKNRMLAYLMSLKDERIITLCLAQYHESITMTDRIAALDLLENFAPQVAEEVLHDFYDRYQNDTLVMNKYLSVLAASQREGTIERVQRLQYDPVYDIKVPNLVRSLIGVFARNVKHFHAQNAQGYRFVADKVIELDAINPQIASGLAGAFKSYAKLKKHNKILIKKELERILKHEEISKNVYEIVEKILLADV